MSARPNSKRAHGSVKVHCAKSQQPNSSELQIESHENVAPVHPAIFASS